MRSVPRREEIGDKSGAASFMNRRDDKIESYDAAAIKLLSAGAKAATARFNRRNGKLKDRESRKSLLFEILFTFDRSLRLAGSGPLLRVLLRKR